MLLDDFKVGQIKQIIYLLDIYILELRFTLKMKTTPEILCGVIPQKEQAAKESLNIRQCNCAL